VLTTRARRTLAAGLTSLALLLGGCTEWWQGYSLRRYQGEIDAAARAIDAAQNDAQRAEAHTARGRSYSEKARYGRAFKLIPPEEYGRLFDLAVKDHDRAIALAPDDSRAYLGRGRTHYDRAALEDAAAPRAQALFDAAKADFSKAIEKDPRNEQAFDMRGLVHLHDSALDQAIADFAEERKVNPRLGKLRLADTYCARGASLQKEKRYEPAIADYEKAIELGAPTDGCECQPDSPLAWLYYETGQYDKSWEVVHKAQAASRWIAPELLEQLKKASPPASSK
jgi:tetratricopeptide (TPR) repeat protein